MCICELSLNFFWYVWASGISSLPTDFLMKTSFTDDWFFFFFNILQLNSLLWAILRSTGGGLLRSLILGERAAVFTDRRTIPTIVALWYLFTTIYAKFLYHSNFWYYYWLGIWCTARTGSPKLSIFLLFRLNKIIFFKIKVLLLTQSVQGVVLPAIEALSKLRTITGGSDRANTVLGGKF